MQTFFIFLCGYLIHHIFFQNKNEKINIINMYNVNLTLDMLIWKLK